MVDANFAEVSLRMIFLELLKINHNWGIFGLITRGLFLLEICDFPKETIYLFVINNIYYLCFLFFTPRPPVNY